MKEIKAIIDKYNQIDFSKTKAALATVSRVEGSSYRRTGARMLVLDDGTYVGGISGGCLEGDALRRAQKAIALGKPSVVTYDTTQDDSHQVGVGLGCNGIIDVLFTPVQPEDAQNPVRLLSSIADTREPKIVVSITAGGHHKGVLGKVMLLETEESFKKTFPINEIMENVLQDIQFSLQQQTSQTATYATAEGEVKVFIEVVKPTLQLVIYGGQYDMYPLVRLARELGWMVTVVMNITKASPSLLATGVRVLHHKGSEKPLIDNHTAVVLMAHDYQTDLNNFRDMLHTKAAYIGLLGPRKRSQKMFDALAQEGNPIAEQDEPRIFAPAGLDIGATTPEEIALSIVAEIKSHLTGRQGSPLRYRKGTIHGHK